MMKTIESYELVPRFDSRKSFYGKAIVQIEGNKSVLYSYGTKVAVLIPGNNKEDDVLKVYGTYSQTTLRHIKEFAKLMGMKAESKKQIEEDYIL